MDFAIVIPTYKRPKDLSKCLDSVTKQSLLPQEVWVIDDDDTPKDLRDKYKKIFNDLGVDFLYYRKNHNKEGEELGLSTSRDLAIQLSKNEAVFILDDDLVLDSNYCKYSIAAWEKENDEKMIGVGGLISNERKKSKLEILYNKIFGLSSKYKWDVNNVGFQVWDQSIKERVKGHYVHGGVCVYKKSLTSQVKFNSFTGGRPGLDDLDFSLRAKNYGYYYIIEPRAKVDHFHSPSGRESDFLTGIKVGRNRKIIFQNNCSQNFFNKIHFFWANLGWILRSLVLGRFKKSIGLIVGYFSKVDKVLYEYK